MVQLQQVVNHPICTAQSIDQEQFGQLVPVSFVCRAGEQSSFT